MVLHAPRPPFAAVSHKGLSVPHPAVREHVLHVADASSHRGVAPPHAGEHLATLLSAPPSRSLAASLTGALPSEPVPPEPPPSPVAPLCPPPPAEASAFELVPAAPPA